MKAGQKCTKMIIVVQGFVAVSTTMDNSRMNIDDLTAGSSINGEMMLFGNTLNVTATCASKVIYYEIDQKSFFSVISEYKEFNNYLLLRLAKIHEGAENLFVMNYLHGN